MGTQEAGSESDIGVIWRKNQQKFFKHLESKIIEDNKVS